MPVITLPVVDEAAWGDKLNTAITAVNAAVDTHTTDIASKVTGFADPNADRIVFWDDSASAYAALSVSAPLTITTTNFAVAAATATANGAVELATSAETITGTDAVRAVTPAGLTAVRGLYVGINAQVGTTYAPVLADQGKIVTITNAAAITVTMPSNTTTAFPIGTQISFVPLGAGQITFVAGAGATTVGTPSLVTKATNALVTLIKISTDGWLATGTLL